MTFLTSYVGKQFKVSTIDIQPSVAPTLIDGYAQLWAEIDADKHVDVYLVDRHDATNDYAAISSHFVGMYISASAPTTVANSAFAKAAGTTSAGTAHGEWTVAATNRITWNGTISIVAQVGVTASISNTNANRTVGMAIYQDGVQLDKSLVFNTHTQTGSLACATQAIVTLAPGGYIELYVTSSGTSTSVTVDYMNVCCKRL